MYKRCTQCKSSIWGREDHKCLPKFLCTDGDDYSDGDTLDDLNSYSIYAHDAEDAAREAGERMDDGEAPRDEREVFVQDQKGMISRYRVTSEIVVQYSASEIEE